MAVSGWILPEIGKLAGEAGEAKCSDQQAEAHPSLVFFQL